MAKQIQFVKDDNTDRDFPDAYQIKDMMFKINGEYVCVDPCGGGNVKHLLGNQHVYVTIDGDDSYPAEKDPEREGIYSDPFATIERAMEYVNTIVAISGNIYIHVGDGTFYVDETVLIDHPNMIVIIGDNITGNNIVINDICYGNINFWFGGSGYFAGFKPIYGIEWVIINIPSNTQYFGDLLLSRLSVSACADNSNGILSGGSDIIDIIEYFIFKIQSDTIDFGDLTAGRHSHGCCSNGAIGLFSGGMEGTVEQSQLKIIDYVTIKIKANATLFAELSEKTRSHASASDGTIGLWYGGYSVDMDYDPIINVIRDYTDYTTFSNQANATFYSNIDRGLYASSGCSDSTYGVFGGGLNLWLAIDYITFATKSNATTFGELITKRYFSASASDGTYGVWYGGASGTAVIPMEYITMAIKSNATNFGDSLGGFAGNGGCSGD